MATISSAGLGSGLPVEQIVSQLMAVEAKPRDLLTTQTTAIKSQISAFGKLQSAISAFRDATAKLTKPETWTASSATSSDPTSVSVSSTGAPSGNYAVKVTKLAAAQSVASQVFPDKTSAIGTGTLTIQLSDPDADPIVIDVGTGEDTLEKIAAKINSAAGGVTASVVTDLNGSRITMRSSATGVENGFTVNSTGAPGSGLASLAFDGTGSPSTMTQTQVSSNAIAEINGLQVESSSNTLTTAVEGLTIKLNKVTTDPVNLSVEQDDASMKATVQGFVDSYNALSSLMAEQTKYDAATKVAGPLQGDRTAVSLQTQFRQLLGSSSGASSAFARLSDAGIEVQKTGLLQVNSTKLDAALDNVPQLKKMFANVDTSDPAIPANDGFAQRLRTLADAVLGVDGALTTRTAGLQLQVTNNDKRADELTTRMDATEKRIRDQYTALDAKMASLNGLSTYMSNQLTMLQSMNK